MRAYIAIYGSALLAGTPACAETGSNLAYAPFAIFDDDDVETPWVVKAMSQSPDPALINSLGEDGATAFSGNVQSPSSADTEPTIGAVSVKGVNLPADDLADIIEPMIGTEASEENLAHLVQQMSDLARDNGMPFARASIPAQPLDIGILNVTIDAGSLDDIRIDGSDNHYLKSVLSPLLEQPVSRKLLERVLLLAGDIPDIWIKDANLVQENGRNILVVRVGESRDNIYVRADNYGTRTYGPARLRLAFRKEAALLDSDELNLAVRTNPVQPSELVYGYGQYDLGVGRHGARLGISVSYGNTQPGGRYTGRAIDGDVLYASAYGSYPLVRGQDSSVWLTGDASYIELNRKEDGVSYRQDRSTTIAMGVTGQFSLAAGRLRTGAVFQQGVDVLNTTRLGDAEASRSDGDGVFSKGRLWMDWTGSITGDVHLDLAMRGQIANRPLLATHEMGIGGAYTVRGYDFSEIAGDNGVTGLVELSYQFSDPAKWLDELVPYAFADGGYVDDIWRTGGGGDLYSAGGGIRADFGKVSLEAETAWPINLDRDESNDKSPHLNVRVNVSL